MFFGQSCNLSELLSPFFWCQAVKTGILLSSIGIVDGSGDRVVSDAENIMKRVLNLGKLRQMNRPYIHRKIK